MPEPISEMTTAENPSRSSINHFQPVSYRALSAQNSYEYYKQFSAIFSRFLHSWSKLVEFCSRAAVSISNWPKDSRNTLSDCIDSIHLSNIGFVSEFEPASKDWRLHHILCSLAIAVAFHHHICQRNLQRARNNANNSDTRSNRKAFAALIAKPLHRQLVQF